MLEMNLTDKIFSSLFLKRVPSKEVMTLPLRDYIQLRQVSLELTYLKLSQEPPGKVIDLGCGTGRVLRYFDDAGWDCHGVDISPASGRPASKFCHFYLRDGEEPLHWFSDSSYHAALAIAVFHHIAKVDFSLSELVRCLKPGGLLVVHEVVDDNPIFRTLRSVHPYYKGMPVLSRMRSSEWLACFNRNGLKVLAAFGLSLGQVVKWAFMLHSFPSTFRDTNPFYPRALFPLFTAIPVGTQHFRPVHVLYVLQKTGAFT